MQNRVSTSRALVWLVPLLLVVFWLGARSLNADSIWFDEWWSIYNTGGVHYGPLSLAGIWERVATEDPWQAPGYFLMLKGWSALVGWEPAALRALSLLLGVLAVAWTYRLGRDWLSARVGLYAAGVMGISAFFVYYLHEMRVYSLFALLMAFVLWTYWRIVTYKPNKWLWVGLLAGATALLYSQYFAALPLAAIGIYHVLLVRKSRRWWQVVGVMALAGVLFLPWVGAFLSGLEHAGKATFAHATSADPLQIIERLAYLFGNGIVIPVIVAMILALGTRNKATGRIWFLTVLSLALILLVNTQVRIMPITRMRYLLGLWPLLALIVALGIDQLRRWRGAPAAALALWLALGLWASLDPQFINSSIADGAGGQWNIFPWHLAQSALRPQTQAGDTLILNVPDDLTGIPLAQHLIPDFYMSGLGMKITALSWRGQQAEQDEEIQTIMDFASDSPRVWLASVPDRPSLMLPRMETALSEAYTLCEVGIRQSTYQIDLYSRAPACCIPDGAPPLLRFGTGIALIAQEPLPDEVTDALPVTLSWSIADDVPDYTYSVALHVLDSDGMLVAQADYGLPVSSTACQESTLALDDLPASEYQLFVIVYAWANGERLSGEVVASGEQGDRLLLGTFTREA